MEKSLHNIKKLQENWILVIILQSLTTAGKRGANENLNGLIRQYFPKEMSFENITKEQVQAAEDKLNNRPRKRFGFQSPNQVYLQKLTNQEKVAFMT